MPPFRPDADPRAHTDARKVLGPVMFEELRVRVLLDHPKANEYCATPYDSAADVRYVHFFTSPGGDRWGNDCTATLQYSDEGAWATYGINTNANAYRLYAD